MALKKSQQSLKNWTRQKWRTKSGKKSSETGERYLPEAAIKNMSDEEYAATTRAKREGTKKGKQFVAQPKEIAKKTKKYRTMKKGGMMKGKKSQMGMVKSAAPKRKKEMSDKEYFEMQDRKRRKGQESMSGQDSVNFLMKLMKGQNYDMGGVLKGALTGALKGAATGAISGIGAGAEKVPSAKSGMRFKKLSRKIQKSGKSKSAADAIAAAVGRKKYGAKKFAAMAAAGRKKRR